MAAYFFESSGIAKRYINETGTSWVISVTDPTTSHLIYVVRITGVEVVSAITRQKRSGNLSTSVATNAIAQFRHDFSNQYRIVEVTSALVTHAMTLAETYALRG